ncbi:hypothetical protein ARSQ2_00660 [Arsenophonus endosymbiont of Bemisia tabaci Q2]|nr:hypothetical protein ARSQ2_00660 [Arsenophonus endosymbiont of Bemisia tabaci Q2]
MRHRYFVRTEYGVIKIKSLSYITQFKPKRDTSNGRKRRNLA